jgi:prepilin-type N-terminal cleavage/methylation domain-containing protein
MSSSTLPPAPPDRRISMRVRSQKGFTLLELLVVVVIVGVLAAAAVPIYLNYVKDSRRAEAKGGLAAIQTAEQAYFQKNGTYADAADNAAVKSTLNCDVDDPGVNYDFSVTGSSATGYTAKARGKGTTNYPSSFGADLVYVKNTGVTVNDIG